jgi:hydroxymethylpyrimidine pyrophosphatase-like HAD family hydrolase
MLSGDGELLKAKKQKTGEYLYKMLEYAKMLNLGSFRVSNELTTCFADARGKIKSNFTSLGEMTQANAWFGSEEDAKKFLEYVEKNHRDDISIFRNGGCIDMPPLGVSKVSGIYDYANEFDGAKIITVGDNVNDIPMLIEFDGYAVSNAKDEVKAIAKHKCDRIADMIDEIMKGNN